MRISTSMIYNSGVSTINDKTGSLLHTQQQLSAGTRIVAPSDDPVAAARAMDVSQAQSINTQQSTNLNNTKSALGLEETQLSGINTLMTRIRQLIVQGGNSSLTVSDRKSITTELRSDYDQLLGLANASDGNGVYLFSGYKGGAIPFSGSVDSLNQGNEISYFGDSGQRTLQVAATRQLPISDPGDAVFKRISNGNGYFATNYASYNTGSGVVGAGSMLDPAAWTNSTTQNVNAVFSVDTSVTPNKTYYDLVDTQANSPTYGTSLLTGQTYTMPLDATATPAPVPYPGQLRSYSDGQTISLKSATGDAATFDLGSNVTITGSPTTGDSFSLTPSTSQSVFKTIATAINVLETANTGTTAGVAKLANDVGFALTNIDQANDHILTVRAAVGSRLSEVDSLSSVNQDLNLQYSSTLSTLQDLDYAKTITDLTRQQSDLQAAQKSFVSTSQLSLFNYIQ